MTNYATNMPLNLFIIGPSGCGKSTQARLIAKKYQLTHFSTGQLFRQQITQKSQLGLKAQKYIKKGIFCPDDLVTKILFSAFSSINNHNFIIDGSPRSAGQPQLIEDYLKKHHQTVTALVHLSVTFEEILKRRQRLGQDFQDQSRNDNSPQTITKRQLEYQRIINPVLDFYQKRNQLIEVAGNRPIKPIFQDICRQINKLIINQKKH